MYPLGPIIEGVGVNVTVFSYMDKLYAGVQGCWELVPDVHVSARGMEESLAELVARPIPDSTGALVACRTPGVGEVSDFGVADLVAGGARLVVGTAVECLDGFGIGSARAAR